MSSSKEERLKNLKKFIEEVTGTGQYDLQLVSGDASFRKYYRVNDLIFVDAPPATEKNAEFVEYSEIYAQNGVLVPRVIASDLTNGYLCISDLGNVMFSQYNNSENEERIYTKACDLAVKISRINHLFTVYDRPFIERELQIFIDWYVGAHAGVTLSEEERRIWNDLADVLIKNDLEQPQGTMHRDFHCRNIMIEDHEQLAVIDFQDTVTGPVTYDLVSLVKDCYITLDKKLRDKLVARAYEQFKSMNVVDFDLPSFVKHMDLTGMQRHLKAIGIFCRLNYRDGKNGYLQYLPRTFDYVTEVAGKYPEFREFSKLLTERFSKR